MNETNTWTLEARVEYDAPEDYKAYALNNLKQKAGNKLYALLEQQVNPAVVEISEEIIKAEKMATHSSPWSDVNDIIRIKIRIISVAHRYVVIEKRPLIDHYHYFRQPTFMARLINWLKR